MASKEALHQGDPHAAAERSLGWRMSRVAKSLWKWGITGVAVGLGVLLATHLIVPVIPVAAATKAAFTRYGKAAADWLLGAGGIVSGLAAGKTAVDAASQA